MTKEQAAQLIDQAIAALQVNRETHVRLQQALAVLTEPKTSDEDSSEESDAPTE